MIMLHVALESIQNEHTSVMTLSIIKAALSLLLVPLPHAASQNLPCLQETNAMVSKFHQNNNKKNTNKDKQHDDLTSTEGEPHPVPSPYLGLDHNNVQVGEYSDSAVSFPERNPMGHFSRR